MGIYAGFEQRAEKKREESRARRAEARRRRDSQCQEGTEENLKESAARAARRTMRQCYCTLQTRSVPGVVPQSVPMGVALVIESQVFD